MHTDTNEDGDVDGGDDWHYFAHDSAGRVVGMFLGSDTAPTEQLLHHCGDVGRRSASLVNLAVLRDRDTTANGELNERLYYGPNWRSDVSTLFTGAGRPKEHVRYYNYGAAFGLPGGDVNSSGATDQTDIDAIQSLIDSSLYDENADLDYDGDVDAGDKATAESNYSGISLGSGVLSSGGVANMIGVRASVHYSRRLVGGSAGSMYHVDLGRPLTRGSGALGFGRIGPQDTGTAATGCISCGGIGTSFGGGHSDNGPTPPFGPPGTKDCCKKCKGNVPANTAGSVCCCDGIGATSCVWPENFNGPNGDPDASALMEKCAKRHENYHKLNHVTCSGKGDGEQADWKPGVDPMKAEAAAGCIEMNCLKKKKNKCSTTPCEEDIDDRIDLLKSYVQSNGGDPNC